MKKTYTLNIPKGTKVLAKSGRLVKLSGDVFIQDATREEDGGFTYYIGRNWYFCSAGCCSFESNRAA